METVLSGSRHALLLLLLVAVPLSLYYTPAADTAAQEAILLEKTWGGSNTDQAFDIAIDSSNNTYVTGSTSSFGQGDNDALLLKYEPSGDLEWQRTWGGEVTEISDAIVVDSSNDVYITGYTNSFGAGGWDVYLLKLNSTGDLLWQKTWGGSNTDQAFDIAIDSSNNTYITGATYSYGAGLSDIIVLKFNSTGSLVWQRTFGGSNSEQGFGIAVDSSDNIYLAGYTNSFGQGNSEVLLLKFNSTGHLAWQRTWGGGNNDIGMRVLVDSSDDVYITGYTNSFGAGFSDVYLLKFNSTGNIIWQRTWGGPDFDEGRAVASDSFGHVFVAGYVAEAPPYNSALPNFSPMAPTFTAGAPSLSVDTPAFAAASPSGIIFSPSGSQTYAGGWDAFLSEYGLPTPTPTPLETPSPTPTATLTISPSPTQTSGPEPSAPVNLVATGGVQQVSLAWQAPHWTGAFPIAEYRLYRGQSPGSETFLASIPNILSYTDTAAAAGITYYYYATAVNLAGESPPSNEASATPTELPTPSPSATPTPTPSPTITTSTSTTTTSTTTTTTTMLPTTSSTTTTSTTLPNTTTTTTTSTTTATSTTSTTLVTTTTQPPGGVDLVLVAAIAVIVIVVAVVIVLMTRRS